MNQLFNLNFSQNTLVILHAKRPPFIKISLLLLLAPLFLISTTRASDLLNAKNEQDQAFKNYYLQLRKLDHTPTQQEALALQSSSLLPAMNKYEMILNETFSKTATEIRNRVAQVLIKSGFSEQKLTKTNPPHPSETSLNSPTQNSANSSPSEISTPPKSTLKIDRNLFKKEIIFGKESPQNQPESTPSPDSLQK